MTESGIGDPSAAGPQIIDRLPQPAFFAPTQFSANAWVQWVPTLEKGARPLTERLLAGAKIARGSRALDVGTGIGDPAFAAARIVGEEGHVVAIDPDPEMIEAAQLRAQAEGISNVTLRVCKAEELPANGPSFDAIFCRWSLMFVDDLRATLMRLKNLLLPNGRLVVGTWGPAQDVPVLSLARRTVHSHLGCPPSPQGPKTAFALQDSAELARTLREAGFAVVEQKWIGLNFDFADSDAYIRFRTDCTGSLFSGVGDITEEQRHTAMAAILDALGPYRHPDGGLTLPGLSCFTAASCRPT